jgi:hypothetical protein
MEHQECEMSYLSLCVSPLNTENTEAKQIRALSLPATLARSQSRL